PNPVVDTSNGKLYIPFLHFGDVDAHYIRVLASDDAGATFHFLNFNVPGVADPTAYPVIQPGVVNVCGIAPSGVERIEFVLFEGLSQETPLQFAPNVTINFYKYITRLIIQPATVVLNNHLLIAFNVSTSATLGDITAVRKSI